MKKIVPIIILIIIIIAGYYLVIATQKKTHYPDFKNATYVIDGQKVTLMNGVSETEVTPGSATKVITRYFGNAVDVDLNNDGNLDVVFLLTQETGGTGTFFYAVAAVYSPQGYMGSDGYFLGDRIAPQNITLSTNPRHKDVIVINYADRAINEPMTTQPSIGKSVYLKMDKQNRWAIVVQDFEGESR